MVSWGPLLVTSHFCTKSRSVGAPLVTSRFWTKRGHFGPGRTITAQSAKSQFFPKRAVDNGSGPKWLKIDHEELFTKGIKKGQKKI